MMKAKQALLSLKHGLQFYAANFDNPLLVEWHLKHRRRLIPFRDLHRGESCFIIGNGPSLNKMDLSRLKGQRTFGLNKVHLLMERFDLDLSYHVAVNRLVIEQCIREFETLSCPSFLSFGVARDLAPKGGHIHHLATNSHFPTPYSFYPDPLRPINEGFTVTFVALQLAFYMGFETVFLIGVDHNFKAAGNPNEEQRLCGEDQNHFDPRYFKDMQWHLPDLESSELSYRLARYFYARAGRRVLDATVDGKLQVFPKIGFEEALRLAQGHKTP